MVQARSGNTLSWWDRPRTARSPIRAARVKRRPMRISDLLRLAALPAAVLVAAGAHAQQPPAAQPMIAPGVLVPRPPGTIPGAPAAVAPVAAGAGAATAAVARGGFTSSRDAI